MTKISKLLITRRRFATTVAAFSVAAPTVLSAQEETQPTGTVEIRTNNYSVRDWRGHFSNLLKGAILVDTKGRTLHYWPEDEAYHLIFPVSVPLTPDLTRLGRTSVVRKRNGPDWRPTPSMLARNPDLPSYIEPGPENPLGTHALYLSWQYYRIHGTNDTRKIGRQSSNGCIGLYNDDIEELFGLAKVGTQVLLI
ncbi:MAG: L,D-transpeptidase [Paracoccaceae bacterium]|jgi:lipoprotein-anchoring transpeptidase ErfK/SrfK